MQSDQAEGKEPSTFEVLVEAKRVLLRKRGFPIEAEHFPPTGQAALWYQYMICHMPKSGREVGRQLARLCGDDSSVTIPWRSLADAVGIRDKGGRLNAYTERGIQCLREGGWVRVETIGKGRCARTTFYLTPGEVDGSYWRGWYGAEAA